MYYRSREEINVYTFIIVLIIIPRNNIQLWINVFTTFDAIHGTIPHTPTWSVADDVLHPPAPSRPYAFLGPSLFVAWLSKLCQIQREHPKSAPSDHAKRITASLGGLMELWLQRDVVQSCPDIVSPISNFPKGPIKIPRAVRFLGVTFHGSLKFSPGLILTALWQHQQ